MKVSLTKIAFMFILALCIGVALDRMIAKNQSWTMSKSDSQPLLVYNFEDQNEIHPENLVDKWVNVQGELTDIQIDSKGEIVLKIKNPLQAKGLNCFFNENIRSKELDQLYSNQKVQLTGLCKRVGKNLILVDCKII